MIITVYSIASILLIPVAGFLSDRYGRKAVMIPCLVVVAAGGLISGLSSWLMKTPYTVILIGRVVQGIGASGAFPVVIPTVGDLYREETEVSKGLGIIETTNTFGKVVSPVLGSALGLIAWFVPFLAIPVLSGVSIVLIMLWVKTGKNEKSEKTTIKDFFKKVKQIFGEKGRWLYAIFFNGFIVMFVLFAYLFYLSTILEDNFHMHDMKKGLVLAIPLLFLCATSLITGNLIHADKKLMKWIIFTGFLAATITLPWVGFLSGLILIILVLTLSGTGLGATLPCLDALITEGIVKDDRGTATSFFSGARLLGVAVGPPLAALLMNTGSKITFMVLAGSGLAAALAAYLFIKPDNIQNKQEKTT